MRFIPGRTKYFGITKVIKEIRELLLDSKYLKGEIYKVFIELGRLKQERLLRDIRKVIEKELLEDKFYKALAKDIFREGEIKVDSYVFQYLNRYIYYGDTRRLLIKLSDSITSSDNNKAHKGHKDE